MASSCGLALDAPGSPIRGRTLPVTALAGGRVADRHLLHLAGLDAAGADVDAAGGAVHQGAHALEVRIPAAIRLIVRVLML